MSKENVVLFSKAINKDSDLNSKVGAAEPTVAAWVAVARDAGFEFTPDEFAAVVGETLGRQVTPENAVREYLGTSFDVGSVELSQSMLEGLSGGRRSQWTISNL